MKTRSLHGLLTLCLLALFAARAGATTIVQTATVPLDTFLNPAVGDGLWDFDAFAPVDGGTLTGASLQTTLPLQFQTPFLSFATWSSSFTLGTGLGFYNKVLGNSGFFASSDLIEFTEAAFTPTQLAQFLDPSQSRLRFGANVYAVGGNPVGGGSASTIRGDATFVLTYEYETTSANVPEAGSTALLLSGALAGLWTAARRRAFLVH